MAQAGCLNGGTARIIVFTAGERRETGFHAPMMPGTPVGSHEILRNARPGKTHRPGRGWREGNSRNGEID